MSCRYAFLLALTFSLASCNRAPQREVERVAIVTMENLSADPALSWAAAAVSSVAATKSAGDARIQVFHADTVRDAQLRLATRVISGSVERGPGGLAVQGTVRDEGSGKTLTNFTLDAADVLTLATMLAQQTGAPPKPYTVTSPAVVQAYFQALSAPDLAAIESGLRRTMTLDEGYGAPRLALMELLLRTNRQEEARKFIGDARNWRLTPVERARLDLISADSPTSRLNAMVTLARLNPGDAALWTQAAETAMNQRRYDTGLQAVGELLKLRPKDEVALNMRVYSNLYIGDFSAASNAADEYRRVVPSSANAIDSKGEVAFYFGRYSEAAALFLEAHARNPEMVGGLEPFRAAWSHYLAGNLQEADRVIAQSVQNPADLRMAIWKRLTGRPSSNVPAALQSIWLLRGGDRARAAQLAATARREASNPAMASLAGIASVLSQPSASPAEWEKRVSQVAASAEQASIRAQLLGWALLLDGHSAEAAKVWRAEFDRASGQFDNEQRVLLAWCLSASGQVPEARKVMPHGFLPPTVFPSGLDTLLHPLAAEVRKKLGGA